MYITEGLWKNAKHVTDGTQPCQHMIMAIYTAAVQLNVHFAIRTANSRWRFESNSFQQGGPVKLDSMWQHLIETLYRENVSFRVRDLKRQIPCHTASENLDAQLLRNDTSFVSNLLCKSPLINYSPTIFVRLFQPIH